MRSDVWFGGVVLKSVNCNYYHNGLCKYANINVPISYCLNSCKGKPKGQPLMRTVKERPQKKRSAPTVKDMAKHFTSAMVRWGKAGLPVCDKEEYMKRRMACKECHGGWTCPVCGCQLWAKAALKTESCPNGNW